MKGIDNGSCFVGSGVTFPDLKELSVSTAVETPDILLAGLKPYLTNYS